MKPSRVPTPVSLPASLPLAKSAGVAFSSQGLVDYVRVVYRHRWIALATMVLVSVPVGLYGILQPKAFEARVRVVVEAEPSAPVPFKESAPQTSPDERTQQEIVRSREVALRTILALRLWEHPAFGGSGSVKPASQPAAAPPSPEDSARAELLVPGFIARTKVVALPLSRLMDIVFEAPEAALAADVANELGRQFIQQDLDARAASTRQASSWLTDRLDEQRKKVEESEAALQDYKEQQDALSVEDQQNIVVQKLSDLNAAVTRAKTERLSREAAYQQVQTANGDPTLLESVPAIAANPIVRQLQTQVGELRQQERELGQRYGVRHPEMVKIATAIGAMTERLTAEVTKAAGVVKNEYLAAVSQEQALLGALNAQKEEALLLNKQDLEYGGLRREAETQRQIYNALAQQTRQTGIAGEFKESRIRILDPARPPGAPVRPQRTKFAALALALGIFAGLGAALARHLLDSRFETPHDIHDHLRIPFVGMVPAVRTKTGEEGPAFHVQSSHFSDALRRVRSTLVLSAPSGTQTTLLVTSTAPKEGKSTLVVGLAQCFAAGNHRVLIIDADLRRPRIGRLLGLKPPKGLSQFLAGRASVDDVITSTTTPNLSVITAGPPTESPSELLAHPRFGELLTTLGGRYDWIFIDSAPVLSVPDAPEMARLTSGILFVVGAQMASRQDVLRAEQQLMQAGVPFAGCVLNRAQVERHSYYYAPYHNRAYEQYYRETE